MAGDPMLVKPAKIIPGFIATFSSVDGPISQVNNKRAIVQSDKALVNQVLLGNHDAFKTIINCTQALVAQIVFKMVENKEDRKDLAQDVYMKAFHKLSGFKFEAKLSTWIGQIAYNTCLTYLEKRKLVFPDPAGNDEDSHEGGLDRLSNRGNDRLAMKADSMLQAKQRIVIVQEAIDQLPPVYKTLVSLYHQEEMSYNEISAITSLPEGTVKSYLFRARRNLKNYLLRNYKKDEL